MMRTEAERNYEIMVAATREVQAAMEQAAGQFSRECDLADHLAEVLRYLSEHRIVTHLDIDNDARNCPQGCPACEVELALRQWRQARGKGASREHHA